ncbi:hypothetical protein IPF37_00180 [bacterium]|nr:MAG: hypothetical protein IPF37_00180 [bacterium]
MNFIHKSIAFACALMFASQALGAALPKSFKTLSTVPVTQHNAFNIALCYQEAFNANANADAATQAAMIEQTQAFIDMALHACNDQASFEHVKNSIEIQLINSISQNLAARKALKNYLKTNFANHQIIPPIKQEEIQTIKQETPAGKHFAESAPANVVASLANHFTANLTADNPANPVSAKSWASTVFSRKGAAVAGVGTLAAAATVAYYYFGINPFDLNGNGIADYKEVINFLTAGAIPSSLSDALAAKARAEAGRKAAEAATEAARLAAEAAAKAAAAEAARLAELARLEAKAVSPECVSWLRSFFNDCPTLPIAK